MTNSLTGKHNVMKQFVQLNFDKFGKSKLNKFIFLMLGVKVLYAG